METKPEGTPKLINTIDNVTREIGIEKAFLNIKNRQKEFKRN